MSQRLPTFADVEAAGRRHDRLGGVGATPVLTHEALDAAAGAQVFIKPECLQTTGSFKIRGALNRLAQIDGDARTRGVVAFSSGNHAQGVARAARWLGMPALIVMPSDAPAIKAEGVRADGGEIRFYDRHTEDRDALARDEAARRGAIVVPSYDDADVIAGQGTAGLEFARQMAARGGPLDHLVCCTGGGGLITGIALAFEALSPGTGIWTAEPEGHDDWARSLAAGEIRTNAPGTRSFCDAILTPRPGELTWALGRTRLAGGLVVSDGEVAEAMRFAARHLKLVTEPGGAAALAVAVRGLPEGMRGQRVGILVTGGNVDPALLARVLAG